MLLNLFSPFNKKPNIMKHVARLRAFTNINHHFIIHWKHLFKWTKSLKSCCILLLCLYAYCWMLVYMLLPGWYASMQQLGSSVQGSAWSIHGKLKARYNASHLWRHFWILLGKAHWESIQRKHSEKAFGDSIWEKHPGKGLKKKQLSKKAFWKMIGFSF